MSVQKLLLVEDENEIRDSVALMLRQEGYDVICAENGADALIELSPGINLVILDVMMPGMSGYEVCRHIRRKSKVPILFLTAKSEEEDVIRGFEEGADDYLAKPFSGRELIMRVRAILRRAASNPKPEVTTDRERTCILLHGIELNPERHAVSRNNVGISITETEYQMLLLFMQNPGRVFSTRELYEKVWKEPFCVRHLIPLWYTSEDSGKSWRTTLRFRRLLSRPGGEDTILRDNEYGAFVL